MLSLERKRGERIIIGLPGDKQIVIEVVDVRVKPETGRRKVRLGFTAPADVTIHREEIWRAIEAERRDREVSQ